MTWRERVLVLGTVFGTLLAAAVIGLIFAYEHTLELLWLAPSSFFLLGKFLPLLSLNEELVFYNHPYELGLVIGIMDTCTVLVIVYSLEALYKLRFVGPFLRKANRNARLVLIAYPWMRKFAITGIVLFVLFPVAGTGAIGGSFIGALLGLHRFRLIGSVCFGGFFGGMMMAFLTERSGAAIQEWKDNPWLIALMITLVVGAVLGMNRAYKKALARAEREE